MWKIRKSEERGYAHHGWLKSFHSFSFNNYYDAQFMGYRHLRVINEDYIEAARGFGTHPHQNMEIITYVLQGALEHQDSMGNKTTIQAGEVQTMSAGSGVTHSEYNPLPAGSDETHLLQIWIRPRQLGLRPSYGQKSFTQELKEKKFVCVASGDGREGSLLIHQDADVYAAKFSLGEVIPFSLRKGRGVWIQVIKGSLKISDDEKRVQNVHEVKAGDALYYDEEASNDLPFFISAMEKETSFLLFDLV